MTALLDAPASSPPPPPRATPSSSPDAEPARGARPGAWRARLLPIGVTALSFVLNAWGLAIQGVGNQYYAAASRSMVTGWSNFFFASFDQNGFISVDKPPVFLWIDAVSVKLFGFNSWSLLLPSAIAGAAAVALLYVIVAQRFGRVAATIAALVLALSPINVAVNRLNLPEPFMILFLVATGWAVLRSFESRHPVRLLVLAGALMGLAFNTKMLAAFIPLPAIGIAMLMGTPGIDARSWWLRVRNGLVFGATTLAVSLSWLTIVDLVPASARPYVGGSTNNTVWDLVFGYNGFGRVNGGGSNIGGFGGGGAGGGARGFAGGGFGGTMNAAGGVLGGTAGPWRLVSDALGGQIAWLLPLAIIGGASALWLHRRDVSRRAALVLWGGWLLLYAVIFSKAEGTFHAYYTSVMTPAIAALVGIGVVAMVRLARRNRLWFLVMGGAALATVELQLVLSGREPSFYGWTRVLLVGLVLAGVAAVAVALVRRQSKVLMGGLAVVMAALLVSPAAWATSEVTNPVLNSSLPQAGPRTGQAGSTFGSASSNGDPALAAWLEARSDGLTWDLVTSNAQQASGLIADQDVNVMALGGFMGTDGAASVSEISTLIASGQVRWFLVSSGGMGGFGGAGGGFGGRGGAMGMSGGTASSIMSAVSSSCTAVTTATDPTLPTTYSGTIYDCAGAALSSTG